MEYKVLVLAGQSNCSGEAAIAGYSSGQLLKKSKTLIWYDSVLRKFEAGKNNRRRSFSEQKGGWEIELATQIEANYNGRVIFLKFEEGATGVATEWNPSTTGWVASQLNQLLIGIADFELFFAENFPNDTFVYKALLWNQGEQDGANEANSLAYQTNCGNTWDSIKTALGTPTIPIYDWYISNLATNAYKANINSAKTALRASYANGGVIYSTNSGDGYAFQDPFHYDAATYTLAGQRLFDDLILNGHL